MAISINGVTVAGIGKDGKNGVDGKDATINGVPALTIEATGGLTGQQSGDTYTIDGSGLVPKTTTVNGKPLSGNMSLAAEDVGADPAGSAASALTDAKAYTDGVVGGLTAADVGARPDDWVPTASEIGESSGTDYSTYRPRGVALMNAVPSSIPNGCIVMVYE